jgi:hypothetical protein
MADLPRLCPANKGRKPAFAALRRGNFSPLGGEKLEAAGVESSQLFS